MMERLLTGKRGAAHGSPGRNEFADSDSVSRSGSVFLRPREPSVEIHEGISGEHSSILPLNGGWKPIASISFSENNRK